VLGDTPLQIWATNGIIEQVVLPLSPVRLFVAATTSHLAKEPIFENEFRQVLALRSIGDQFRKADKFVIARDVGKNDGLLKLAEINLKMPDGSLPLDSVAP
jgi:hypothetical protein